MRARASPGQALAPRNPAEYAGSGYLLDKTATSIVVGLGLAAALELDLVALEVRFVLYDLDKTLCSAASGEQMIELRDEIGN